MKQGSWKGDEELERKSIYFFCSKVILNHRIEANIHRGQRETIEQSNMALRPGFERRN